MSLFSILRLRSAECATRRDLVESLECELGAQTYLATALIVDEEPVDQFVSVVVEDEWLEFAITVAEATAAAAVAIEPSGVADVLRWNVLELGGLSDIEPLAWVEPVLVVSLSDDLIALNLVITLKKRSASSSQIKRKPKLNLFINRN